MPAATHGAMSLVDHAPIEHPLLRLNLAPVVDKVDPGEVRIGGVRRGVATGKIVNALKIRIRHRLVPDFPEARSSATGVSAEGDWGCASGTVAVDVVEVDVVVEWSSRGRGHLRSRVDFTRR